MKGVVLRMEILQQIWLGFDVQPELSTDDVSEGGTVCMKKACCEQFDAAHMKDIRLSFKAVTSSKMDNADYGPADSFFQHKHHHNVLKIIPPEKKLFDEVHRGPFGEMQLLGMQSNIIQWCRGCLVCASRQVRQAVLPLYQWQDLFDRVGVDVLHFPKSTAGNQYAIVFVDYLIEWPEVFATRH